MKDATSVEFCAGKTWAEAERWLRSNSHMLALARSRDGHDVAKSFSESGEEAGTAVLAAVLALRRNKLGSFVREAVRIYKDVAKEAERRGSLPVKKVRELESNLASLEFATDMVEGGPTRPFEWPVRMPDGMWEDLGRRCGMARVMLVLSLREMDESTTTELVASAAIMRFLERGTKGGGHGRD